MISDRKVSSARERICVHSCLVSVSSHVTVAESEDKTDSKRGDADIILSTLHALSDQVHVEADAVFPSDTARFAQLRRQGPIEDEPAQPRPDDAPQEPCR